MYSETDRHGFIYKSEASRATPLGRAYTATAPNKVPSSSKLIVLLGGEEIDRQNYCGRTKNWILCGFETALPLCVLAESWKSMIWIMNLVLLRVLFELLRKAQLKTLMRLQHKEARKTALLRSATSAIQMVSISICAIQDATQTVSASCLKKFGG